MNLTSTFHAIDSFNSTRYTQAINLLAQHKCLNLIELRCYYPHIKDLTKATCRQDVQADLLPLLLQLDSSNDKFNILASLVYKYNQFSYNAMFIKSHYPNKFTNMNYRELLHAAEVMLESHEPEATYARTVYYVLTKSNLNVDFIAPINNLDYYHLLDKVTPSRCVEMVKLVLQTGNLTNLVLLINSVRDAVNQYREGAINLTHLEEIAIMLSSINILRYNKRYEECIDNLIKVIVQEVTT